MGDFAQGHGARHAGAAFERMQLPGEDAHRFRTVRIVPPRPELPGDGLAQFGGFLQEDGQQLFVDFVADRLDRRGGGRGRHCGHRLTVLRWLRQDFRCGLHGMFGGGSGPGRLVAGAQRHCRDGARRIEAVEFLDQVAGNVDAPLFGQRREHRLQFPDRPADRAEGLQAAGMFGVIAALQRMLQRISQLIDRKQADRGGNARQRMCRAVHVLRRGLRLFLLENLQLAAQGVQIRPGLFREYGEKRGRNADALPAHVGSGAGIVLRRRCGRHGAGEHRNDFGDRGFLRGGRRRFPFHRHGENVGGFLRADRCEIDVNEFRALIGRRLRKRLGRGALRGVFLHRGGHFLHRRRGALPGFGARTQGVRARNQVLRIGRLPRLCFQVTHPLGEHAVRLVEQPDQRGIDRQLQAQPEVQGLLDGPCGFAQILETDHAAAALQGMEGAPDAGQIAAVVQVDLQAAEIRVDRLQHVLGLLDEDGEQFRVDFLAAGLGELQGFLGGRLRFQAIGLERRHHPLDLRRDVCATGQNVQHGLGLLAQPGIGDQVGVALQRFEVLPDFLAQTGIRRLLLERLQQRMGLAPALHDFLFDGDGGVILLPGVRSAARRRPHLPDEALEVRRPARHGFDEKSHHRQLARQLLEFTLRGNAVRDGEAADGCKAVLQRRHSPVLAEHGQRADDLPERRFETDEFRTLFRVAEKAVEHLFDLDQVALDFLGHLPDQQPFLRPARHLVEQRNFRARLRRTPRDAGMDPLDGHIDLMREVSAQVRVILLRVLYQQDGRGELHGQGFGMAHRLFRQPVGGRGDGLRQAAIVGMPGLLHQPGQSAGIFPEHRQRRGTSRAELVPCFFQGRYHVAQSAGGGLRRVRDDGIVGHGKEGIQAVGLLDLPDHRVVAGDPGDEIERVPHQPFGDIPRSFEQAANLHIDAGA